jgi:hypothetical protein
MAGNRAWLPATARGWRSAEARDAPCGLLLLANRIHRNQHSG